ncbi:Tn3 family transposase [Photorhabdus akhurstii]|uniref:Tn3 family transposase n=1 Tax=Photorhabdus akhurstii TaxID=171438 RepID=UPI0011B064DC
MIRKLPNARRNNLTLSALFEYNRPVKCIYALEYVDNQTLRQVCATGIEPTVPV